jgi:hypothetical protein
MMKRLLLSLVLVIAVAFSADAATYILTWTDTATGESAWQVQRKVEGGAYSQLGSDLAANSTTTTDNTAADGTSYRYRVRAIVGGTGQPFSNEACMPVACAPAAPTNVHVTGQAVPAQMALSASVYVASGTDDPAISFVTAVPFVTGTRVTWMTDTTDSSRVDYGLTSAYGSYTTGANGTGKVYTLQSTMAFHVVTISGLAANTTYHYKVTSGTRVSANRTFTTYASPTGTVRTVGASGKDYTTVAACATAAQPGWTCLVYAGSYTSISPASGTVGGGYVTILGQEAASISGLTFGGKNYVAVKGLEIIGSASGTTSSDHVLIENNYLHNCGYCITTADASIHTYLTIRKNVLRSGATAITPNGTNILIDGNDMSDFYVDCIYDGAIQFSVIRNTTCHDYGPQTPGDSNQHVDFLQWDGNNGASGVRYHAYNLLEGNTAQRCMDTTGNCHFLIIRDTNPGPTNEIVRYNFAQQFGGSGMTLGTAESVYSNRIYNNTFAFESRTAQSFYSSYNAFYTKALNNLSYNSESLTGGPWDTATGIVNNYDVAYDTTSPNNANWGARYTVEATYNALKNTPPSFVDYPQTAAIQSSSALKDKGGNLTTVTSGCGTSTLTLADVRWFQPGWAGTQADTLAIGATVAGSIVRQVTGVNYSATYSTSSGTVTFAALVACTNGDKVWLYAKSDGVRVLYGTAPDIGAYEVGP